MTGIDTKINRIISNTNHILTGLNNIIAQERLNKIVKHITLYNDMRLGYTN